MFYKFSTAKECENAAAEVLGLLREEINKWPFANDKRVRDALSKHARALMGALGETVDHIKVDFDGTIDAILEQLSVVNEHLRSLPYSDDYCDAEIRHYQQTALESKGE